jgi:hypothetical protein
MSTPFDVRWLADTLSDPPVPPPVLVDGMLRAGELCVIGAPRATGKTWLGLNLAALVGRGDGYLFGTLQVSRMEKVLVCHGETPPWMAAERWRMLLGDGPTPEVADSFERWRVGAVKVRRLVTPPEGSPPFQEESFEGRLDKRLAAAVARHGFGLVVVDPWAVFYAGSENSNDEVEAAVDRLRLLADETGAAIVVVHHLGKAQDGRDPEDLWRGASRLPDAASTRVTMLPLYSRTQAAERGLPPDEARRYVSVRFLRREAPTPGFNVYLGHDGWWERCGNESSEAPPTSRSRLSVDDVTAAIAADGGRFGSITHAARSLDVSREAAATLLDEAKRAGLVVEVEGAGSRAFELARSEDSS